tara:strand:+ start:212 stop:475 length:264 start_codon:yes stop_codon:yes gene_type:complete
MKKLELITSKDYEKNIDTFGDDGTNCIVCGRKTNEKHYLHMTTDWEMVPNNYDCDDNDVFDNGETSQGLFPIGPICMRKYPKEFIHN